MRKILSFLVLFFAFITIPKALPLPTDVTADSVVVMDMDTGEILYEKNPDKQQILASLTKMMTAYTALDHIKNLDKKITITEEDFKFDPVFTLAGLEVGDQVSYRDLLYGMLLQSGAEAAQALANHTMGSVDEFVAEMNKNAKKLGLNHTHFSDTMGGEDDDVSTAREYAILMRECLKNKTFKTIFGTNHKTLTNGVVVHNYTQAYAQFHGLDPSLLTGNKTGYTSEAGLTIASTATINDIHYGTVLLKCSINEYLSQNVIDAYKVYDFLKTIKKSERTILKKDSIIKKIPVEDSTINNYIVILDQDVIEKLTDDEYSQVSVDYHLTDKLTPSNRKGDNIGYIDIKVGETIIDSYNFYLDENVYTYDQQSRIMILLIIILIFVIFVLFGTNLATIEKKHKNETPKLIVKK